MGRINVYDYDGENGRRWVGHFKAESAEYFPEDTEWRDATEISVPTGTEFEHQGLYRTRDGNWVLAEWSQYRGVERKHRFIGDETARAWLIQNDEDAAVDRYFGEVEEESGPNLGGRPAIGGEIRGNIGTALREHVDRLAAAERPPVPRAEMVRRAIAAGLDELDPARRDPQHAMDLARRQDIDEVQAIDDTDNTAGVRVWTNGHCFWITFLETGGLFGETSEPYAAAALKGAALLSYERVALSDVLHDHEGPGGIALPELVEQGREILANLQEHAAELAHLARQQGKYLAAEAAHAAEHPDTTE